MAEETTSMTLGQQRVGVTFNPSQNAEVAKTKDWYAERIDELEASREGAGKQKQRTISRAQASAEDACMLTVKSIFQ